MHDVAPTYVDRNPVATRTGRGSGWGVAIGNLIALIILVFGIKALQVKKMMSMPHTMPPTAVSTAVVKAEDWAPTLSAVGSVSAVEGAIVATELGGVVSKVEFQNGGVARKAMSSLSSRHTSSEEAQLHHNS